MVYQNIEDLISHIKNTLSTRDNNSSLPKQSISSIINEISIVGMSYRFPGGVVDYESCWNILNEGGHISAGIPFNYWDSDWLFVAQYGMTEMKTMRVFISGENY